MNEYDITIEINSFTSGVHTVGRFRWGETPKEAKELAMQSVKRDIPQPVISMKVIRCRKVKK